MNEKIKVYILPVIFCLVAMCMCLGAGIWLGRSLFGTNETDSKRAERHQERSESAENAVGKLESGLGSLEEQVRGTGREIESGIADVGELGSIGDRIAGTSEDIAQGACRIEDGIQRVERILYEAEEKCGRMDDYGDSTGCGGSD